ncbi:MAG: hypothetical protein SF053_14085 [Bacteroidia bacterium]|nr:hypothetical protein [Bacteroidia bacterium]
MRVLTGFSCLVLLLSGCAREFVPPTVNDVSLAAPAAGQRSWFLRYETPCDQYKADIVFTGDTLVLEIVGEGDQLKALEYLTPGSPQYTTFPDTVQYPFSSTGDAVMIPYRSSSRLFFFYDNDTLPLTRIPTVTLKQQDCMLTTGGQNFTGLETGLCETFEVGGSRLTDKRVVSCVPLLLTPDAYLIFDDKRLYISHIVQSETVSGWISTGITR